MDCQPFVFKLYINIGIFFRNFNSLWDAQRALARIFPVWNSSFTISHGNRYRTGTRPLQIRPEKQ